MSRARVIVISASRYAGYTCGERFFREADTSSSECSPFLAIVMLEMHSDGAPGGVLADRRRPGAAAVTWAG